MFNVMPLFIAQRVKLNSYTIVYLWSASVSEEDLSAYSVNNIVDSECVF